MYYIRQIDTTPVIVQLIIPKIGVIKGVPKFVLELRHTATHKTYTFTTTTAGHNANDFFCVTTFDEIPNLGQYDLIMKFTTGEIYYTTMLEIVPQQHPIPQNNRITTYTQYNG